jgi:hypothetical protein
VAHLLSFIAATLPVIATSFAKHRTQRRKRLRPIGREDWLGWPEIVAEGKLLLFATRSRVQRALLAPLQAIRG